MLIRLLKNKFSKKRLHCMTQKALPNIWFATMLARHSNISNITSSTIIRRAQFY